MANKYIQASREAQEAARRLRGCESKRAYASPQEASQGWQRPGQTIYHCHYCGKYHRSGKFARFIAQAKRSTRLKHSSKWTKRS